LRKITALARMSCERLKESSSGNERGSSGLGMRTLDESGLGNEPLARHVRVTSERLNVELKDGRTISAPLEWYPRLKHATPSERNNWKLIADGYGIHWPDLDEDLSVEGILAGRKSAESPISFKIWLYQRKRGLKPRIEPFHIDAVKVIGPHRLRVTFNTGESKDIDLSPLLTGPVFGPLRDPSLFKRVRIDPDCETIVWPNGADLAPEALYDFKESMQHREKRRVA